MRFLFCCIFNMSILCLHAQTQPSIQTLTLNIKNNPKNPLSWYKRGNAYFKLGKFDAAVSDYTKCLEFDPDNMKAIRSRGIAYYKMNKLDSAIDDFSTVLDDSAYDKGILQLRGDAYKTLRRFKQSGVDYSDFLDVDTTKEAIWYERGVDYYKMGSYDTAVHDLTKALSLEPANTEYLIRLILALTANDDYNQANNLYTKYLQKKQVSYIDKPDYAFLKNYLQACTKYLPNKDYSNVLPLLLACKDLYKPGADSLDKSDSIEYANVLVKIGTAYENLDTLNTALDYYTQAQRINSNTERVTTKIIVVKNIIRVNTTPSLIYLDSPAHTTRGQYITARISKKNKIYVKGSAKAPAGVNKVKVNDEDIEIDSSGIFESYIPDTSSIIHIEAWTQKNIFSDTTFKIAKPEAIPLITENYYAIFIANTNYTARKWPPLETTIKEAEELKNVLIDEYSFLPENIDTIYNQPKREILTRLDNRLKSLGENDNVLIFYGGHGEKDDKTGTAYWIPVDATDEIDYIKNQDLDDIINRTDAKHVLIMADACYSSLMRSAMDDDASSAPNFLLTSRYSRQLLTSGNAEPVPGVSVFIPTIITTLKTNPSPYISALELFINIFDGVKNSSHKEPVLQPMQVLKSNGGQFFFKRKSLAGIDSAAQAQRLKDKQLEVKRKVAQRDSLVNAGLAFKKNFDVDAAINAFQAAVKINPEPSYTYPQHLLDEVSKLHDMSSGQRFKAYADTAAAYENMRDHVTARDLYLKVINMYPDKKDSLNTIVNEIGEKIDFIRSMRDHLKFGTFKDALKECNAKIKKYRNDPEYYYWRANCYAKMTGHYSDAIDDYNTAIEKQRSFKEAIKALADFYRDNNRKKDAIDKYRSYVTLDRSYDAFIELYKLDVDPQVNFTDDAIEDLSSAITINSDSSKAYFYRGYLYYTAKGDVKKAFADFNSAVQKDSLNSEARFWRGNCYLKFNNLADAAADYNFARDNGLDNINIMSIQHFADTINDISKKFSEQKIYDSAISAVNRAILIDPVSPAYRFEKGYYYYMLNKLPEAINSYDSSVYRAINDAAVLKQALIYRGIAYYDLAKYKEAIDNFAAELKLNPLDVMTMKKEGDSYFALNSYDSSTKTYETTLKVVDDNKNVNIPDSVKSLVNNGLGYSRYALKLYDGSVDALKKAIRLNENNAEAYYNLSKTYEAMGDYKNAATNIDKAVSFSGYASNYIWNNSGGDIYREKNDYAKAEDYYTKAINNDTERKLKNVYYSRGYCYFKNNGYADAAKDYLTAISYHTDTTRNFYYELGTIYLNLQNTDSAYIYYNTSLSRDSSEGNAAAAFGMGCALFLQNKTDDCMPFFEKAFKGHYPKSDIKDSPFYDKLKANKPWKSLYGKYY